MLNINGINIPPERLKSDDIKMPLYLRDNKLNTWDMIHTRAKITAKRNITESNTRLNFPKNAKIIIADTDVTIE